MADDRIFVSIAAYRDPQLVPTVEDCLAKARFPDRFRFGICWQHGAEEGPLPFNGDVRFRVLDIDWRDGLGACWARSQIMRLWQGEGWFLQVDSHCRFTGRWDEKLLAEAGRTGSPRPVLSTYATPFVPSVSGEEEVLRGGPLLMALQGFTPEGIPHMKPMAIPNWQQLRTPVRARFVSAGFLFADGAFVTEVGYDPGLYFLGEEAALTVRAFTHGYDLFHPSQTIVWHDYVRKDAAKHWDDHNQASSEEANQGRRDWSELDRRSKAKLRRLLNAEPVESYGLGQERALADYEAYAGISFALRKAQQYTLRCEEPPNPETPPDWAAQIYTWMARINLERASLPPGAIGDASFWYVGVEDELGREIYRKDFSASELEPLSGDEPNIALVVEFQSGDIPARWTVWPVSRSRGWLPKIQGLLAQGEFSIISEDASEASSPTDKLPAALATTKA